MQRDAVKIEGIVVEALPNLTYRVELPNGHRLLVFLPKRLRVNPPALAPWEKVTVEVSPCDLSVGRLAVARS